ncbi:MAG: phosphoribosyltransferase [Methanohalobium sp.]|uniref:phosphoribosyltransferase n=1 Tax=Methanohalobium sp. TaxID=2837493 RepID=UPI0039795926
MFKDRTDAGKQLAKVFDNYRDENVLVLAIPRGGVEIGYQVAIYLNANLSLLISRKLPFPYNPEAGFGAVAEDGSTFINECAARGLSEGLIESIKDEQIREIKRRIEVLRNGEPLPDMKDRTVILTDDGLAMGSTMNAAIKLCKNRGASKIVVAVPVAGREVVNRIGNLVDDIIVLDIPPFFQAVAQVYENWYDVSDNEVLEIMNKVKT